MGKWPNAQWKFKRRRAPSTKRIPPHRPPPFFVTVFHIRVWSTGRCSGWKVSVQLAIHSLPSFFVRPLINTITRSAPRNSQTAIRGTSRSIRRRTVAVVGMEWNQESLESRECGNRAVDSKNSTSGRFRSLLHRAHPALSSILACAHPAV